MVLLREFFFRELLFYCSVARLQWRDGVSRQHGGDGARDAREAEAMEGGLGQATMGLGWVDRGIWAEEFWGESRRGESGSRGCKRGSGGRRLS